MPAASPTSTLRDLGWDDQWASALAQTGDPSATAGRVSRIDRGISTVLTAGGARRVAVVAQFPLAVGDWVTLADDPSSEGALLLTGVLPRRCAFRRVSDGAAAREQVVAANIDTVLLVDAIDSQLTARHLERYVALGFQSGAVPVIVITKSDLASPEEVARHVAAVEEVAGGVTIHVLSAASGAGLEALRPYLAPGRTVALLGLSGAGKSTLVNLLAGAPVLATGEVRSDGKGRHTTTYRELVPIPGGAMLIDTPGMRALSVATATEGIGEVFADIEDLATRCAYPDCTHTTDDGCAVVAAVASGALSATRLASWRRLQAETPGESRSASRQRIRERKDHKASAKMARSRLRASQRRLAPPA